MGNAAQEALASWAASLRPVTRGRLLAFAAVLLLCFDTPTYRLIRLRMATTDAQFGFAVLLWRSLSGFFVCSAASLWQADGVAALVANVKALGARDVTVCSLLLAFSNTCFTVAVSLTTAANVLVCLALGPLFTALVGRAFLGIRLAPHTWAACVCGFGAVALVFSGSFDTRQLGGTALACLVPLSYAFFLCISSRRSDTSTAVCMLPASLLLSVLALCVLGGRLPEARPVSFAQLLLCVFNGGENALALQLFAAGCALAPGAEVALINLLETALSPFLVYALVGEKPSAQTIVAGVLVLLVLAAHALYDMHLERKAGQREEGFELLAPAEEDALGADGAIPAAPAMRTKAHVESI